MLMEINRMEIPMRDACLALNAGSSSLKFAVFDVQRQPLLRGAIEGIGGGARVRMRVGDPFDGAAARDHAGAVQAVLDALDHRGLAARLRVVGHRVVHGGRQLLAPARIDGDLLDALRALVPLAPLHQPNNLATIEAVAARWPRLPQVACFDTAFHATQPRVARHYALPRALTEAGVLRYGFHGLSFEYIADALEPATRAARVIVAHLGNGASLCAMRDGRSVATTMGFSTLDGLPMGTRCGSLDPAVVLYLQRSRGLDVAAVEDLLYRQSGLLGVSGLSSDMQALVASGLPQAAEAVELFCYRVNRELGSLVAALGGLDVLVFTGGIGEHAAAVRERICALAAWTGLRLDSDANRRHAARIAAQASRVDVHIMATDEEAVIARHAVALSG
jgi:acetate kinase